VVVTRCGGREVTFVLDSRYFLPARGLAASTRTPSAARGIGRPDHTPTHAFQDGRTLPFYCSHPAAVGATRVEKGEGKQDVSALADTRLLPLSFTFRYRLLSPAPRPRHSFALSSTRPLTRFPRPHSREKLFLRIFSSGMPRALLGGAGDLSQLRRRRLKWISSSEELGE
jgi:hypothetical protein